MTKRLTWFLSGAVAGVATVRLAKNKVKQTASNLAPVNVARNMAAKVRGRGHEMADAVRDGRRAMQDKEAELRARRDGRVVSLADELEPDDQVLVHGQPVEAGQVIVVKQVRSGDQSGPRRNSRRVRRGA